MHDKTRGQVGSSANQSCFYDQKKCFTTSQLFTTKTRYHCDVMCHVKMEFLYLKDRKNGCMVIVYNF